jgi:uncharacterized protein (DUF433 family)
VIAMFADGMTADEIVTDLPDPVHEYITESPRCAAEAVRERELPLRHTLHDVKILVEADTDFGTLLSRDHAVTPSVILVRRLVGRRAKDITDVVLANLDGVREDIEAGAIVVLGEDFVRVRVLPIRVSRVVGPGTRG